MAAFLAFIFLMPVSLAQGEEEVVIPDLEEVLQQTDTSAWEELLGIGREEAEAMLLYMIRGEGEEQDFWVQWYKSALKQALGSQSGIYLQLSAVILVCRACMEWVQDHALRNLIARVMGGICAAMLAGLVIAQWKEAEALVERLLVFLQGAQSCLASLALFMGAQQTASVFLANCGLLSTLFLQLLERVLYPAWIALLFLRFGSFFVQSRLLSSLSQMMARISQWILTFACGIGVAWMKFRMGTAAAADTVTRRTLRIAVEQGLPVVGGYLRDMVDTAIFSAGLMQTALGSLSLAAVMVTVLPCVLRMAIGYILMELTAFCADSDIAEGMHAAASLHLLFVGVTVLAAFWVLFCLGQMVAAVSRILGAV